MIRRTAAALGVIFVTLVLAGAVIGAPRPPDGYYRYGRECAKIQQRIYGLERWSSILLAQIHQESAWDPLARSPWASGLAQFIPSTQRTLERELGVRGDIWDPDHACFLQAHLMLRLARTWGPRADGYLGPWALSLRAYNGAPATLQREWVACGRPRLWTATEPCRARSPAHHRENVTYPHRIFRHWSRIYWPLWEGAT